MFRILFVCTGNLCRSPMAERFAAAELARRLGPGAGLAVSSAGTRARPGMAMSRHAADVLVASGADPRGFASRELTEGLIRQADLLLAAARDHRRAALTAEPSALRRSFTLVEFARTAEVAVRAGGADLPPGPEERARAVVAAAARRRGTVPPPRPDADDLTDPIGCEPAVYQQVGAQIRTAVTASLDALLGPAGAPE